MLLPEFYVVYGGELRVENVLDFYSTTSRTTVPNPAVRLLPRADERLQTVTDIDEGSEYMLVVVV